MNIMKEICMPKDKNTINSTLEFLINIINQFRQNIKC